jgi:eukaryotic-like serine/threonine-protein kinase
MRVGAQICRHCGQKQLAGVLDGLCDACLLRASVLWPAGEAIAASVSKPGRDLESSFPAGRRTFGDYELEARIAIGGMGEVFRARQISLDRIVAVKMVRGGQLARATDVRRFQAEAVAVARLRHPHIVTLFEAGEQLGQPYFAMEYVDGADLGALFRKGPLSYRRIAEVMSQVADAVHHAHSQGVLHRDLKPSNILMTRSGEPRVSDFGLATAIGGDSKQTASGALVGSPAYMSPEQASGRHRDVGPWSDIYSLGATLYELLTGRPPFQGPTPVETLRLVHEGALVRPRKIRPEVPPDLETISLKCLERDPARRYRTAREVADELDRFLRGESVHARPVGLPERAWRWCKRQPALAGALATILLSLATGGATAVVLWRRAELHSQREHAVRLEVERQEEGSRLNAYGSAMLLIHRLLEDHQISTVKSMLRQQVPQASTNSGKVIDPRGWEWFHFARQIRQDAPRTLRGLSNSVCRLARSPDGRFLVSADENHELQFWNIETGRPAWRTTVANSVSQMAFTSDGQYLLVVT